MYVMADDMADVMADGQDFKQGMLVGETFSEILVEGQKREDSMFCGSSLGKLAKAGQFFLNELQKQPFYSYLGSCKEHKFSYSCYVMIDHHVIHIFYIFLLPLISIAYSDSIYDCELKVFVCICFCSLVSVLSIITYNTSAQWSVCANQLYISWKFLVGGTWLNIINQWGNHEKVGGLNLEISVGEQKGGTRFLTQI